MGYRKSMHHDACLSKYSLMNEPSLWPRRATLGIDEDFVSTTRFTQSLLAERFIVDTLALALDGVKPSLVPWHRALLVSLQLEGTGRWLLAVPISGLQQTLNGRHYYALMRYRLCMQMFVACSTCTSCRALLCHGVPHSSDFQIRHRLV